MTRLPGRLQMGGGIVIIFDFDRTLIEDDSDRWVLTNMGITQLFNQLRPTLPWNSLMGLVIKQIQTSISEIKIKRLIYDGMNDLCPTLKLGAGGCVMPRKNFPLWVCIMKNSELVKSKVYDWGESEDLAQILLKLINS